MARLNLVAANKEARAPRVRASARPVPVIVPPSNDDQKDHFITKNGLSYAGSHLIIDLWEAEGLADRERIETALIDQRVRLSVLDRGPGIPPADAERMLQPFTRLNAARSTSGTRTAFMACRPA